MKEKKTASILLTVTEDEKNLLKKEADRRISEEGRAVRGSIANVVRSCVTPLIEQLRARGEDVNEAPPPDVMENTQSPE